MFSKLFISKLFRFHSILFLGGVAFRRFHVTKTTFSKLRTKVGSHMHNTPQMMTIREIAKTGLLSEHALRLLLKEGKLPLLSMLGTKHSSITTSYAPNFKT